MGRRTRLALLLFLSPALLSSLLRAAAVPADLSEVKPGAITVSVSGERLLVRWPDENGTAWQAAFSLDPAAPLIESIGPAGANAIIERARPLYWADTGKRRGGWDQFFDFPPSHPEGTRRFTGDLRITAARARSAGDRVEILFDGLRLGPFRGCVAYVFYPGSRLVQQMAIAATDEPDTAYSYDAGLRMAAPADRRAGGNMESEIWYFDTQGQLQKVRGTGPERVPAAVRYRAIAARTAGGTLAVFPAPHQYFFARDFTTNMSQAWHTAWRGNVSLGIRQLPDDFSPYYPWMNAPPGSRQRMSVFLLLSGKAPPQALDEVRAFTRNDRYQPLEGYKTMAAHWHFAYTVQAMEKGLEWQPPFKSVLKAMGVDAAMIADFHGDGHPADTTDLRLEEVDAYYRACRAQSDAQFLLIPSEEANVHFGGHWAVAFPKPVLWFLSRPPGAEFMSRHPRFGPVYRVANAEELLDMVRREKGLVYQTHPRTKGSTGFPDKIRDTQHFLDPHYFGAGWKAMPSDLSSPRLGERSLKLVDDMNNWGLRKRLLGEVDVFQIDSTHELWAHMNINYVRAPRLPSFDNYGELLEAMARGNFFVTTGEILLPETSLAPAGADEIAASAEIRWTFPLEFAEVVWGDGTDTHRAILPLDTTRPFGSARRQWKIAAKGWKWARLAVWDVAGNGAFINPVWR